ncbi:MAG: hypothetical protein Q7W56_01625 [Candidatus Latescibacteria bacterium]|nr:hypothetical protein [Candidatus Latescibacterota bacterium]
MSTRTLWILAVVVTLASALYQRMTGPSYPVRVRAELAGAVVKARLERTHSVSGDLPVRIRAADPEVMGEVRWRRYPLDEPWREVPLSRDAKGDLVAQLPAQPPAGKLEYTVHLSRGGEALDLPGGQAVVARFKGDVPPWVLAPHILLMFLGMLWSNRAGLEAVFGGAQRRRLARRTLALLAVGGLFLGPVVQKYAFGAYWTGWPFGEDLTDNKLAAAVLAWTAAALIRGEGRVARLVTVLAALVVFAVYMIPHSLNGSTLDYASMKTVTG